ncbi:hypothetical protein HNP73_003509, partial [Amaricoccus macauensis]
MTEVAPRPANAIVRPLPDALVDAAGYSEMYGRSVSDPEGFWGEQGGQLDWI